MPGGAVCDVRPARPPGGAHVNDAKAGDASRTVRRVTNLDEFSQDLRKTSSKLGSNVGPKPPKHPVKRGFGRYQKAGRVNYIAFPA
jgi:hypothetical protein